LCGKVKIAVVTRLPAKRYVEVDAGHSAKVPSFV
jgi:hypothetical protein